MMKKSTLIALLSLLQFLNPNSLFANVFTPMVIVDEVALDSVGKWQIELGIHDIFEYVDSVVVETANEYEIFRISEIDFIAGRKNDSLFVLCENDFKNGLQLNPDGDYIKTITYSKEGMIGAYTMTWGKETNCKSIPRGTSLIPSIGGYSHDISPTIGEFNTLEGASCRIKGQIKTINGTPLDSCLFRIYFNEKKYYEDYFYGLGIITDTLGNFSVLAPICSYENTYDLASFVAMPENFYYPPYILKKGEFFFSVDSIVVKPDTVINMDIIINHPVTDIQQTKKTNIPTVIAMPNPFSDYVDFNFIMPNESNQKPYVLKIFSYSGQLIASENIMPSQTSYRWDGISQNGKKAMDGVYIYNLEVENRIVTSGKMVKNGL